MGQHLWDKLFSVHFCIRNMGKIVLHLKKNVFFFSSYGTIFPMFLTQNVSKKIGPTGPLFTFRQKRNRIVRIIELSTDTIFFLRTCGKVNIQKGFQWMNSFIRHLTKLETNFPINHFSCFSADSGKSIRFISTVEY